MRERLKIPKPTIPIAEVVLIILLAFVLVSLAYTPSRVKGGSMLYGIRDGDIVMVANEKPRYQDIVTAKPRNIRIIKRVVGVPNDVLVFRVSEENSNHIALFRNGVLLLEDYIPEPMLKSKFASYDAVELDVEIVLGSDEYFLLGDNRNFSEDSREIGAVKREAISGVVGVVFRQDSFMAALIRFIYAPEDSSSPG